MISHEQSGPINGQWSAALILRKKHLIDPLTVIFFSPQCSSSRTAFALTVPSGFGLLKTRFTTHKSPTQTAGAHQEQRHYLQSSGSVLQEWVTRNVKKREEPRLLIY